MTQNSNRRDVLQAMLLGGAALAVGLTGVAHAAEKKKETKTSEEKEVLQLSAALDKLDASKYTVVTGPVPTGTTAERLLCSPAGSTTYYQDTRAANAKVTIYTE